ncbi:hypothetical protein [Burkholderia cepacia]|uniref:hypothetical protein n=1 Tax=Burkholderia cepacia TaxID=292 RepID=UPI00158A16D0|nr:hypothetical protein [Burkholderia cepacia]
MRQGYLRNAWWAETVLRYTLSPVFGTLQGNGITRSKLPRELCLAKEDTDNLTFGSTLSSLSSALEGQMRRENRYT